MPLSSADLVWFGRVTGDRAEEAESGSVRSGRRSEAVREAGPPFRLARGGRVDVIRLTSLLVLGCTPNSGKDTGANPTDSGRGACGDVSTIDLVHISGGVRSSEDQTWVPNVDLALEERNWDPGHVHGTARTDANGQFTLTAEEITVVDGCWGLAVSYWLVGVGAGPYDGWAGEKPLNPVLIEVWETGDIDTSLGQFPMFLRPPEETP
jgi:hypothetical protein